jgi:hypothetical protein
MDARVGDVLGDLDAALEAFEAAVHMGHADMLGDEADRRVRRVEEPGPRDREVGLPARLEPYPLRGGAGVGEDVDGLAVRFQPLRDDHQAVAAGRQHGHEQAVRVRGAARGDLVAAQFRHRHVGAAERLVHGVHDLAYDDAGPGRNGKREARGASGGIPQSPPEQSEGHGVHLSVGGGGGNQVWPRIRRTASPSSRSASAPEPAAVGCRKAT